MLQVAGRTNEDGVAKPLVNKPVMRLLNPFVEQISNLAWTSV
jgi:hypothetical protein